MKKNAKSFAKHHSISGFVPLVLLLIVGLVAVAGYFAYQNYQLKQISSDEPQAVQTEVSDLEEPDDETSQIPTTSQVDNTSWTDQTLADYSFMLPNHFVLDGDTTSEVHAKFSSDKFAGVSVQLVLDGSGYGLSCVDFQKADLGKILETHSNHAVEISLYEGLDSSVDSCNYDNSDKYFVLAHLNYPNDNLNDLLIFEGDNRILETGEAKKLVSEILSTFVFTNDVAVMQTGGSYCDEITSKPSQTLTSLRSYCGGIYCQNADQQDLCEQVDVVSVKTGKLTDGRDGTVDCVWNTDTYSCTTKYK